MIRQFDLSGPETFRLPNHFLQDFEDSFEDYQARLNGKDVIVLGAAGSIGWWNIPLILSCSPRKILLLDFDENSLTNLLRFIRTTFENSSIPELRIAAMDYGSQEAKLMMESFSNCPILLNFAAAKHVRSQRDVFGISHLFKENFLKPKWLIENLQMEFYFMVSTDKAANPANFMGASKALHEKLISGFPGATTRFANVAFSKGSLLESWKLRLDWRQPLVVPMGIKRFLINHADAARLCAISIGGCPPGNAVVPKEGIVESRLLSDVCIQFVESQKLDPIIFERFEDAKLYLQNKELNSKSWPIVLTNSQTHGEKEEEIFISKSEKTFDLTEKTLRIPITNVDTEEIADIERHINTLSSITIHKDWISELETLIRRVLVDYSPIHSANSLDERP